MLILSAATMVPSLAGLACESKEKKAADKAAIRAVASTRAGDDAGFDELVRTAESPELRRFAEDARAKARDSREFGE